MICPKCKRPYFFIDEEQPTHSRCIRCFYSTTFLQPVYDGYHDELYIKPYRRDLKTDPQMVKILRLLQITPKDVILDLGCGVGDYSYVIKQYTKNVIGVDLSISAAKTKFPGIEFRDHDLNTRLPFTDASFDTLVSINLIEHLRNARLFLDECARILKPAGKIAITTANLDFILHNWFYDKTHVHEWKIGEFRRIMERNFNPIIVEKSSSMFNYYPLNLITTKFLKPDLLFIGTKIEQ